MEIADNAGFAGAVDATEGETTGFAAGTYYVRLKATATHEAGDYATVGAPEFVPGTPGGGSGGGGTAPGGGTPGGGPGGSAPGGGGSAGGGSGGIAPGGGTGGGALPATPAGPDQPETPAPEAQPETGGTNDNSQQPDPVFTDIDGHWAKDAIRFAVNKGLFSGTSADTFSPNDAMTRGMFVTVLGRMAEIDLKDYPQSRFSDVNPDAYYMSYIEWAGNRGIVSGIGNGAFAPDQPVTREQMAVMMLNYARTHGISLPKAREAIDFADSAEISDYAKEAVKQMQMAGILSGKNDNRFDPKGTVTRAEVAAVLQRFAELAESGVAE